MNARQACVLKVARAALPCAERRRAPWWAWAWMLVALTQPAAGQLPVLNTMIPAGAHRGAEARIRLTGVHLEEVRDVLLVSATGVGAVVETTPAPSAEALVVRITVAPDAPLTERELRVLSPQGLSNPIRFFVGQWPVVEESEPNGKPDQAQVFQGPASLQGSIQAPGDVDLFRFRARKGQRLILEVDAARRGSKLQPVLEIKDAAGRAVPATPQSLGKDVHVRFDAPADGEFDLSIRDANGQGGEGFDYRIRVGPLPYQESVVPLG